MFVDCTPHLMKSTSKVHILSWLVWISYSLRELMQSSPKTFRRKLAKKYQENSALPIKNQNNLNSQVPPRKNPTHFHTIHRIFQVLLRKSCEFQRISTFFSHMFPMIFLPMIFRFARFLTPEGRAVPVGQPCRWQRSPPASHRSGGVAADGAEPRQFAWLGAEKWWVLVCVIHI